MQTKYRKINIAQAIGTRYNMFGILLLADYTGAKVEAIIRQNMYDAEQINIQVLQHWLAGNGQQPVAWKTLIEVLHDVELNTLATDIEAAFF